MSQLALYLFGSPRIELDHQPITVDTRKAIALLAYLALARQPHSRDALAALLWPEYDQRHAYAALRRTLSALNTALGGYGLVIERESIALDIKPTCGSMWNTSNRDWPNVAHTVMQPVKCVHAASSH